MNFTTKAPMNNYNDYNKSTTVWSTTGNDDCCGETDYVNVATMGNGNLDDFHRNY